MSAEILVEPTIGTSETSFLTPEDIFGNAYKFAGQTGSAVENFLGSASSTLKNLFSDVLTPDQANSVSSKTGPSDADPSIGKGPKGNGVSSQSGATGKTNTSYSLSDFLKSTAGKIAVGGTAVAGSVAGIGAASNYSAGLASQGIQTLSQGIDKSIQTLADSIDKSLGLPSGSGFGGGTLIIFGIGILILFIVLVGNR